MAFLLTQWAIHASPPLSEVPPYKTMSAPYARAGDSLMTGVERGIQIWTERRLPA